MRESSGRGQVVSMTDYVRSSGVHESTGNGVHYDLAHLLGYGRGEIRGADGEAIIEHCRTCRWCGDQLAAILVLMEVKGLRAARKRRIFAAVAATVVLGVALGVGIFSGALRSPEGATVDGGATAVQEPPAGSGAEGLTPTDARAAALREAGRRLATTTAPDRVELDFMYPNALLSTNDGSANKRAGLALIVDGDYPDAVRRLAALHAARPADAAAAALLGMARYLNGEDDDGVASLLRQGTQLQQDDLQHYAAWYLANLHLRRGDVLGAEAMLQGLSQWPDSPGRKAGELLARLRTETR